MKATKTVNNSSLSESLRTQAVQSNEKEIRIYNRDAVIFYKTLPKPPDVVNHEVLECPLSPL